MADPKPGVAPAPPPRGASAPPHDPAELAALLEWLYRATRGGRPRDPERMRRLIDRLGLTVPTRAVHVVGTNGKGSVTAMIAAGYTAAGIPAGRFTSPHVERFNERLALDGREITDAELVAGLRRLRATPLAEPASFFELALALALDWFAARGAGFAAFEAGVGARSDATIALPGVQLAVLTSVALDHQETLGGTLERIAADKAAAARPGVPLLTAERGPVLAVAEAVAHENGSRVIRVESDSALAVLPSELEAVAGVDPAWTANRRLAAAALRLLGEVPESAVRAALAAPPLPARRERFVARGVGVLLDGAHDPAAAAALTATLVGPYVLLFGALPRKQAEATLERLERGALRTFVTRAGGEAVSVRPAPGRERIDDPAAALDAALAACPAGATLVIAGSLYLAGELRPLLRALQGAGRAALSSPGRAPAPG